jgi:hypothetical protein
MKDDETPISPITAFDCGPVRHYGLVLFRPHYLTSEQQPFDEPTIGPYFALTPQQVLSLMQSMNIAVRQIEEWTNCEEKVN